MNRISPVWILTSLTGEAFDKFKEAIDQQFKAFSETELNGFQDCATHQWWGVETTDIGLAGKWSPQTGYPNGIPAYQPNIFPLFDGNQGIVIYFSPLQEFTKGSRCIEDLKNDPLFFQTYGGNKFFYGLTSFYKEETGQSDFFKYVQTIETDERESLLFNSVTFLSDSSHVAGVNPNGYQNLNEDDFLALVVNTIFSIAITKRELYQLDNAQERLFNTAGVFSFTFEPDAMKKSKAYHLSEQLLEAFCHNKQDAEWYSQNDAKTQFDNFEKERYLHWHSIYKQLTQGFEEESLKGLYSKSEISPWRMFAYKLVPFYFRKHLKPLLRKLYNNVHDFSSITVMRYESFAKNKRQQMLDGTAEIEDRQQFAMSAISDYLSSVWSPNYSGAKGVQQVLLLLEKMRDYLKRQKEEIARVKVYKSPNDEEFKTFPVLHDYPLSEIAKKGNEHYYKHYIEFVTNGEPPVENTEDADKSYEERQFSTLRKLIEWHPMPLNLFTKAGLLSVLAFVAIWTIISIIQSTNLIHIFSLETDQSLVVLFCTIAVLILIFAFVKYGLRALRKIRLAVEKYIAWSYYRLQREIYSISLDEVEKYYDELILECNRIDTQLKAFAESEVKNKPRFERYRISKFQRNILDNMDDGSQILENAALNVSLNINNNVYSPDVVALGLFDDMLRVSNQNLDERMRECVLMESDSDGKKEVKEELLRIWSDILVENIQVLIYGQHGNSVDFPAFHNTPTSNFTIPAWQSANALIHPSVYVYAMNPYSWVISIIPNGNGHANGDRWENLYYGPNHVNQKVPDYAQVHIQPGWFTSEKIAVFLRIHAYDRLIVQNQDDTETTIFNNQLI